MRCRNFPFPQATAALLCTLNIANAHHASEFLSVEGFDIGHRGDGLLNTSFDWENFGDADEFSTESGIFYSPISRVGIGLDTRFAESPSGDWVYSSVSPKIILQLTDPHSESLFRFAVSVGYQFAEDLRQQTTVKSYEEITTFVDTPVIVTTATAASDDSAAPTCNPVFDLDCDPATSPREPRHTATHSTSTSSITTTSRSIGSNRKAVTQRIETKTTTRSPRHKGIHNHDSRQWNSRLVMETKMGKTKIVANLIGVFPVDDQGYWGYAIGARREVVDRLALSIEGVGDLSSESDNEHEIITAAHFDMNDHSTLRLGAGFGLSDASPDFTLRAGLLWRF